MNIEKEIEEMKNRIVSIEEELNKQKKEVEDFVLLIKFCHEKTKLFIGFYCGLDFYVLGHITNQGKCYFLTHEKNQEYWELWKEHGFKVAEQGFIMWMGLGWCLCSNGKLVSGDPGNPFLRDSIYYFQDKTTVKSIYCDNGFLKKDSDRRIHIF
jgi:hypothetical protein